jgi:hypothetical protein
MSARCDWSQSTIASILLSAACRGSSPGPKAQNLQSDRRRKDGKTDPADIRLEYDGKTDTWSYMDGARVQRIVAGSGRRRPRRSVGVLHRRPETRRKSASRARTTVCRMPGRFRVWTGRPRIDISTRRDGRITRRILRSGRVDAFRGRHDADSRVDKWETYANGKPLSAAFDTSQTGRPTRRLVALTAPSIASKPTSTDRDAWFLSTQVNPRTRRPVATERHSNNG